MDPIGARLKEIRLKKGLSLEQAHSKTKINLNILRAIEEDNFTNISPVYIKGFIKIYCEFLGVDPKGFSPDARPRMQQPPFIPSPPKEQQPPMRPPLPKKVKVVSSGFRIDRRIWIALGAGMLIGVLIFGLKKIKPSEKKLAPAVSATVSAGKKRKPLRAPRKTAPAAAKTVRAAPPQKPAPPREAPAAAVSGIRLGIHAKEDCWVQLKIDGKAVFQSVLRKGRYEVWQAKDKIELSLGNVGGVELELNGKVLQPLGRRGQSLKNIVITKEGLKVER